MPKKILLAIFIIFLLIVGAATYLLLTPQPAEAPTKSSTVPGEQQPEPATAVTPGVYTSYSESAFSEAKGTRLLFFHAAWCEQCRMLEADIQEKGVPGGVTIFKIDYDTSQELRQKYEVTLQTTIVRVDEKGELVKKFVAYDDPSVDAIKANLL